MLTAEQLEEFHSSGIVCMRGAVARSAVEEMLRSVWSCLRDRCHIQRDEPDTWPEVDNLGVNQIIGVSRFTGSRHLPKAENFVQVGTAGIRDALDKIFGASPWQRPDRWGSLLVTFAESREAWDVPASGWHFDLPATVLSLGLTAVRVFTCLDKIRTQEERPWSWPVLIAWFRISWVRASVFTHIKHETPSRCLSMDQGALLA